MKLKEVMKQNEILFEKLRLEREEKDNQYKELISAKDEVWNLRNVIIPDIQMKFENYKKINDEKIDELQMMLTNEMQKAADEVTSLSKNNIELMESNKTLQKKVNEYQIAISRVRKKIKRSIKCFSRNFANHRQKCLTNLLVFLIRRKMKIIHIFLPNLQLDNRLRNGSMLSFKYLINSNSVDVKS